MAVGDVYKFNISMTGYGQNFLNTFAAYQKTSSVTPADFANLAAAYKEIFRGSQSSQLVYRSWRAIQVRGGNVVPIRDKCIRMGGVVFEATFLTQTTGGSASADDLPPQCAMVVTVNTGQIGRRHRGRLYVPGWPETAQTTGSWSTTINTNISASLASFANIYKDTGTDPTWTFGVWSERTATGCVPAPITNHPTNVDPPDLDNAFSPMQSLVFRSTVFTQRRRALGVGR